MRVRTFLRRYRGDRSITDVVELTGIARGEISMLERGQQIPRDEWIPTLEAVYGDRHDWYPAGIHQNLLEDLPICPGSDEELDPDASRRRIYHSEACRGRARRRAAEKFDTNAGATRGSPPRSATRPTVRP